ncbi:sans fille-like protein [Rozella allomycis CSF55]|uniref:Nucleotide-binding, alpha-beta plait domain-containing protein n=1 Tax=Rozella allomycis (strain CSF55) TaxID=988480 RepID=A0A075AZ49_ROZAC|nr:Nucleotide-binding, alpha-beta plait domain-containing protein [Rozella allomycis CSF55]RKP19161.1 sans fille-like protein [Rozella allomycis CSF55]|eukprot:EPZ33987.1 Nucleotide-binding, alpha-beta plait domain-containing protein [Rozella allomycis CSF55]
MLFEEKVVPGTSIPFNSPNNTIYIQNLPEKMRKVDSEKILYELFEPYGNIVQIKVKRNINMRGQAFIVFSSIDDAMKAVEGMQSYPVWFKPMRINYAKFKSYIVSKSDGTFDQEYRKQLHHKQEKARYPRATRKQVMQQLISGGGPMPNVIPHVPSGEMPNKVLFLQQLPPSVTEGSLRSLFQPFGGFRDIRLVPGKSDIAFIEFETEMQATMAKNALLNYKIDGVNTVKITYARR